MFRGAGARDAPRPVGQRFDSGAGFVDSRARMDEGAAVSARQQQGVRLVAVVVTHDRQMLRDLVGETGDGAWPVLALE